MNLLKIMILKKLLKIWYGRLYYYIIYKNKRKLQILSKMNLNQSFIRLIIKNLIILIY